jgi:hypothetical protein
MAIYNPPKMNNAGSITGASGDALMGVGGILTASGIAAPIGMAVSGVGVVAKGVGSVLSMIEQNKQSKYNEKYNMISQGEENAGTSAFNNFQSYKSNYINSQVSSSIKAINKMIEPTTFRNPQGGGTELIDKRIK